MRCFLIRTLTLFIITLTTVPVANADVDWQILHTIKFENEPLDMLITPKDQRVYVLTDQGQILVYAMNGRLKGKMDVGFDVVQMKAGPNEERLFLLRSKGKSIQTIAVHLTEKITIDGSPFKGSPKASVTIAVFSDFQ